MTRGIDPPDPDNDNDPVDPESAPFDPAALLAGGLAGAAEARGPSVEEMAEHFPQLDLLEVLGQGGMGIVYRARQRSLDRAVALKVLTPPPGDPQAFEERFQREARALAKLEHPSIVRIFEHGTSDGLHYLVMELVDGVNLRQLMDEGALTTEQALSIVPQICAALQSAHEMGVVHRDIKPENVLLDKNGNVKIADFGLARMLANDDDTRLTRRDQVMGTLHYMAPEQFETPADVDHRADIYSLGVVLYEMLTGELPIGRFDPPSERVQVDVRLDRVVLRALAKQRDRRYQAAVEFGTDLDAVKQGGQPSPSAATPESRATTPPQPISDDAAAPPPRRSTLAACALLAVPLAVLILVVGGILADGQSSIGDHRGAWGFAGFMASVVGVVGVAMGVIAATLIRASEGRLTGHRMAITAAMLPILATPIVWGIAYVAMRATAPQQVPYTEQSAAPKFIEPDGLKFSDVEQRLLRQVFEGLVIQGLEHAVAGPDYSTVEGLDQLYGPADLELLKELSASERERRGRSGELGLALMSELSTQVPLRDHRTLGDIAFEVNGKAATVLLTSAHGVLAIDLAQTALDGDVEDASSLAQGWRFRATPVGGAMDTLFETVVDGTAIRRRPIGTVGSDLTGTLQTLRALIERGVSHALSERGALGLELVYSDEDHRMVRQLTPAQIARLQRERRLGLALLTSETVPEPLTKYTRLTSIEFSAPGSTALIELRGERSALKFRCTNVSVEVDRDLSDMPPDMRKRFQFQRRWFLAALPVELLEDPPQDER